LDGLFPRHYKHFSPPGLTATKSVSRAWWELNSMVGPKYLYEEFTFLGFVPILSASAYECPSGLANGRITAIFSLHHSQTLNPGIINTRLFLKHFK
jgi:hypothetical protein